jgi:hypothetical protein
MIINDALVKVEATISADQLNLSEIGRNRMLGLKVDEVLQHLQQKGGIGDATLTFCKWRGGYKIHGTMQRG